MPDEPSDISPTDISPAAVEVVDVAAASRFEARIGEEVVGVATYDRRPGVVIFTHTEVSDDHEGEGVGSLLVRAALDAVTHDDVRVIPRCPFVRSWIERHPDYEHLLHHAD